MILNVDFRAQDYVVNLGIWKLF